MKFFNLTTIGIILCCYLQSCNSRSSKNTVQTAKDTCCTPKNLDSVPDTALISLLDQLARPKPEDTDIKKLALVFKGVTVDAVTYNSLKALTGKEVGFAPLSKKYAAILPLTTNQKTWADLIIGLAREANILAKTDYKYSMGGPHEPQQNKIAYLWGSKTFEDRKTSPDPKNDQCPDKIHGLDCSGFIYQIFLRNGVDFPLDESSAENERQPAFLKRYLKAYFGTESVVITNLGRIPIDSIQAGDIVYFKKHAEDDDANHIGIVLKNVSGNSTFFHSSGYNNGCPYNMSKDGGVVGRHVSHILTKAFYYVIRITAK